MQTLMYMYTWLYYTFILCCSWKDNLNVLNIPIFKIKLQYICEKVNILQCGRGTFFLTFDTDVPYLQPHC